MWKIFHLEETDEAIWSWVSKMQNHAWKSWGVTHLPDRMDSDRSFGSSFCNFVHIQGASALLRCILGASYHTSEHAGMGNVISKGHNPFPKSQALVLLNSGVQIYSQQMMLSSLPDFSTQWNHRC